MADYSKFDNLLGELTGIETQVSALRERNSDLTAEKKHMQEQIDDLKKENDYLRQQVAVLSKEVDSLKDKDGSGATVLALNQEERDLLKGKINQLISRIDLHLNSTSQ